MTDHADNCPAIKATALTALRCCSGEWLIPDTWSMRHALDYVWLDGCCEKSWVDGENAYRMTGGGA